MFRPVSILVVGLMWAGLSLASVAAAAPVHLADNAPEDGPFPTKNRGVMGNVLYYAGYEDFSLWRSDGTVAGTYRLKDLTGIASSTPREFALLGNTLFFVANSMGGSGSSLWKTDGTAAGTVSVGNLNVVQNPKVVDGLLYFSGAPQGGGGFGLWRSDGTSAGTYAVVELPHNSPSDFVSMGGILYFAASALDRGTELWRTDGTVAGTYMVKDVYPGSGSTELRRTHVTGNLLIFCAYDPATGHEMWRSDGTEAGTHPIIDTAYDGALCLDWTQARVGSHVYYQGTDAAVGSELFKTDGTPAGTGVVRDIAPGPGSTTLADLIAANGRLYFFTQVSLQTSALWTSDGTPQGTVLLKDLSPGRIVHFHESTVVGRDGRLYFVADTGTQGAELWSSDGTPDGTRKVTDLAARPQGYPDVSWVMASDTGVFVTIPNSSYYDGSLYFVPYEAVLPDPDGDGIPSGVESDEGTNAFVKDNDVFGNARLFAMQQYRDFLGREGDERRCGLLPAGDRQRRDAAAAGHREFPRLARSSRAGCRNARACTSPSSTAFPITAACCSRSASSARAWAWRRSRRISPTLRSSPAATGRSPTTSTSTSSTRTSSAARPIRRATTSTSRGCRAARSRAGR